MNKNLFITLLITTIIFLGSNSYAITFIDNDDDVIMEDTTKMLYYIDGKQVSYSTLIEKGKKGEIRDGLGAEGSKDAILMYGEKYRHGVFFFQSHYQEDDFQLNGKIDSKYDGNQIMLFTFQQDTILSADTTIIKNGQFFFRGKEYLGDFSVVATGNYPDKVLSSEVILNKGTIYMELGEKKLARGGELNDKFYVFSDSIMTLFEKFTSPDSSLRAERLKIYDRIKEITYNCMIENKDNLLGIRIFTDRIGYFHQDPRFDELCDIFDKERKSNVVKSYLKSWAKSDQRSQNIGQSYKDFEFQTPDGISKKLSDYVGKSNYIYLDFWASWCGPCIKEMPHLKKVYEKYKDEGFEIISISLDTNKELWTNALNRINTSWIHLCDFEGSSSKVTESYHIEGVPCGILLDKEGIILATNLSEAASLDKKMQELFE